MNIGTLHGIRVFKTEDVLGNPLVVCVDDFMFSFRREPFLRNLAKRVGEDKVREMVDILKAEETNNSV